MNDFMRILIATLFMVFTGLALASYVKAEENKQFYLKMGTGINKIAPIKFDNNEFKGKIKLTNSFPLLEAERGNTFRI